MKRTYFMQHRYVLLQQGAGTLADKGVDQYAFASRILAAFTACASQCSVTMTLARIVHVRRNSWICASTMGLSVFCLLIVLLVTGAGCPSDSPVAGIRNDKCATLVWRSGSPDSGNCLMTFAGTSHDRDRSPRDHQRVDPARPVGVFLLGPADVTRAALERCCWLRMQIKVSSTILHGLRLAY